MDVRVGAKRRLDYYLIISSAENKVDLSIVY